MMFVEPCNGCFKWLRDRKLLTLLIHWEPCFPAWPGHCFLGWWSRPAGSGRCGGRRPQEAPSMHSTRMGVPRAPVGPWRWSPSPFRPSSLVTGSLGHPAGAQPPGKKEKHSQNNHQQSSSRKPRCSPSQAALAHGTRRYWTGAWLISIIKKIYGSSMFLKISEDFQKLFLCPPQMLRMWQNKSPLGKHGSHQQCCCATMCLFDLLVVLAGVTGYM